MSMAPNTCCAGEAAKKEYDDWDDVRLVLYNRHKSSRANDAMAAHDAANEQRAGFTSIWY